MNLLDPVQYPGAIKAFAKEVCRNDLLNFGRLHFFFPDSRLALDLNTDKTLKARLVKSSLAAVCAINTWKGPKDRAIFAGTQKEGIGARPHFP